MTSTKDCECPGKGINSYCRCECRGCKRNEGCAIPTLRGLTVCKNCN